MSVLPGATRSTLQVTIDPSGLAPKTYNETLTISAPGASPPSRTIAINVTVNACWISVHNAVGRGISGDNAARPYDGVFTNGDPR